MQFLVAVAARGVGLQRRTGAPLVGDGNNVSDKLDVSWERNISEEVGEESQSTQKAPTVPLITVAWIELKGSTT